MGKMPRGRGTSAHTAIFAPFGFRAKKEQKILAKHLAIFKVIMYNEFICEEASQETVCL